jgi:asparagine N-glycosylation enzyme membrane subunit Stt3
MTREEIKELVESKTGHSLIQKKRNKEIVVAKRVYFYIGRKMFKLTNQHLCTLIKVDHSTSSIHYDRAVKWVNKKDIEFCNELNKVLGYEYVQGLGIKKMKRKSYVKLDAEALNDLIEAIPEEKRDEALERIKAMVKGYNMVHGKDKITIIEAYE